VPYGINATMALTSQILGAKAIGLHVICSAKDLRLIGIHCQLVKMLQIFIFLE